MVRDAVRATAAKVAPINQTVAIEAGEVVTATGHKDPGDCYLIATARVRKISIISRDTVMIGMAGRRITSTSSNARLSAEADSAGWSRHETAAAPDQPRGKSRSAPSVRADWAYLVDHRSDAPDGDRRPPPRREPFGAMFTYACKPSRYRTGIRYPLFSMCRAWSVSNLGRPLRT